MLVCDAVGVAPRKARIRHVLAPIGPGQDLELAIRREARRALTELRRLVNDIAWPEVMTAKAALKASQPRTFMDAGLSGMFRAAWRKVADALWYVAERTIVKALSIEEVRHRTKFMRSLNAAIGIDLGAVLREGDLAHQMELAMQRSVGLIRGLSDETAAALEKALIQLLTEGASNERIAKTIAERFGFAERRARFIARDQAATFNSELNRIRLQQIGVTEYVWSTALDERVRGNPVGKYPSARPSHWEREGKVFKWSDPPEGGHPGMAINCRCVARAVLSPGDAPAMQEQSKARQAAALKRMAAAKAARK